MSNGIYEFRYSMGVLSGVASLLNSLLVHFAALVRSFLALRLVCADIHFYICCF